MTEPTRNELLRFANLQVAAEAFLSRDGVPLDGERLVQALVQGNNQATLFTASQARVFADQWEVLDQQENTTTGFSGTLFRNIQSGELVMSLRSTEFVDDAIRDTLATGSMEIKNTGFAWGQIADMEAWYQRLQQQQKLASGQPFTLTGYSLGGHLATAFNLLHPAAASRTVTFNAAGVGRVLSGKLGSDPNFHIAIFPVGPASTSPRC